MTGIGRSITSKGVLEVLHLCDDLVAVAKPSGLLVHRGWGDDDDVLVDRARALFGDAIFPVHRLDRGTSGVIVLARSSEIARVVHEGFERGAVTKHYVALVRGAPVSSRVESPIPRREGGPKVPAATLVECLATAILDASPLRETRYSVVLATPETGRLHQVRRHVKSLGSPVIGDANYGRSEHNRLLAERVGLHRLALHALRLELDHPRTGERLVLRAGLPDDLAQPLGALGFDVPDLLDRAARSASSAASSSAASSSAATNPAEPT